MAERINAVKTSFFGKGAIRLLGPELQKMGIRRALLVTDRFLYDSGAAARVGQVLSDAGVEYAVYYNVQPNPTVQVVNDCIAAARTLQVQLLVALGGGGAFAYIKFIKPKQGAKVSADPDDYEFEDEEYENEDVPEQGEQEDQN